MARQSFGSKLVSDLTRGFMMQTGRSASKDVERKIKKKFLDNKSTFRKQIDNFVMPGRFVNATTKMRSLINGFYIEYTTSESMLQRGTYLMSDIGFIEEQLNFIADMIFKDEQQEEYTALCNLWVKYKAKI